MSLNDLEEAFPRDAVTKTQEQVREELRRGMKQMLLSSADLSRKMEARGDLRPRKNIIRSIDRSLSGETSVSNEMIVIVNMLLGQQRRLLRKYSDLVWDKDEFGRYHAKIDDWHAYISPQTYGRWLLRCASGSKNSDYSPPFGRWLDSLEEAKLKALSAVEDGMTELANLYADD